MLFLPTSYSLSAIASRLSVFLHGTNNCQAVLGHKNKIWGVWNWKELPLEIAWALYGKNKTLSPMLLKEKGTREVLRSICRNYSNGSKAILSLGCWQRRRMCAYIKIRKLNSAASSKHSLHLWEYIKCENLLTRITNSSELARNSSELKLRRSLCVCAYN